MVVNSAPLAETLDALQRGQHSLSLYLEQMCRRIDTVDGEVRAFLPEPDRLARLHSEARALREHVAEGALPPLYGALVGVKDIFRVDGFATHAGSALPPEELAGEEAAVVTRLRDKGALIAGKTVTTEFAYFEPGPTRNPHNPAHTPGGSSSGSAAAVAAGLCTLALGTQTIGSVIRPAAFCGIVGYKPSLNRIPTEGLVYFSRTMDHVGLFAQDIEGMAMAAAALCDTWEPAAMRVDLPVLGVPDGPYLEQTMPEALAVFEETLLMLQVAGCSVVRIPAFADITDLNVLHRRLVFGEFAREHARWFEAYGSRYRPRTVDAIRQGQGVSDTELEQLRAETYEFRERIQDQMRAEGIDVWVCPPALGPAPAGLEATGDPNMNLPWTHAGMPAVTAPAGFAANGLPLGLQIVARFGADEALMAWASMVMARLPEYADVDS
jgi:Asp-tRNA(Asn)/Glu-tRNA(Gln) amidotransferase A subunit family amidase